MNIGNAVKIHSHLTTPGNLHPSEAMSLRKRIQIHVELLQHGLRFETTFRDTVVIDQEIQRLQ